MRLRAVPHSEGGERGAEGDFSFRYPLFALRLPSRRLGGNALLVWIAHPLLRSCIMHASVRRGGQASIGLAAQQVRTQREALLISNEAGFPTDLALALLLKKSSETPNKRAGRGDI